MRYRLGEIAKIVGGQLVGQDCEVECVVTDSRNNAPAGALFVAIKSATNDGHRYVGDMMQRGVRAFLVQEEVADIGVGSVVVSDTLEALQRLAEWHRERFGGVVVAITGSNGKTIVKEWFAQMWDVKNGKLFRSPRSYNSQLGVALSLLMIEGDERIAFIEAGISKVGEMEKLEKMIKPNVGVFTNLGAAHDDGFGSREEKRYEKEILFKGAKCVVRAPEGESIDEVNRRTVLDIYKALGVGFKESDLKSVAMRLEVKEGVRESVIINDSYSNDITSLGIAMDFAERTPAKRRVLILSDIAGGDYVAVAKLVEDHKVDLLIGVGDDICNGVYRCESVFFGSTDEFLKEYSELWIEGSVVLVKGGRAFEFEKIVARLEKRTHMTVLEVNLERVAENLNYYRKLVDRRVKIMTMVKANGYGSGNVELAVTLEHLGVDYLAVAYADEGMQLRQGGVLMPIVVLNSDNESYEVMIENRLEPEIYSFETLDKFVNQAKRASVSGLPIHIKIDSGMHRLGFRENEIERLVEVLNGQDSVYVASVFSHFAASEDAGEDQFSTMQYDYYKRCADVIVANVKQSVKPILHICNTAAIERFPHRHLDMVRVGIGLYTKSVVSSLVTKIAQVRVLESGETVGYNRKGKIEQKTKVAVLPIGYADGIFRAFGNGVGQFCVNGVLCPTVGNVCMDTCMVDVSMVEDVKAGDRVVVFGENPTVQELAKKIGTIDYEILTAVAPRIKRVYVSQ